MSDSADTEPFVAPPTFAAPPPPAVMPTYAAPPGYASPPGYAPSAQGIAPGRDAKNWMGITSLILSLSSLVIGFSFIAGIVLGHMGLAAARRGEATNRGVALAGVIIGWSFLGLSLIAFGLFITLVFVSDTSTY